MHKIIHTNRQKIKEKLISQTFLPTIILSLITVIPTSPASALSYETSADVQFTFNPAIGITVSGDLYIDDLAPGSYSDSNVIDINVVTNNINGYNLYATVGSSEYDNTYLNHGNTGSNAPKFTSLLASDSYASFSDENIAPNTWGYSYANARSRDGGSWQWTNYSGLPLYNDTAAVINNSISRSGTTKFKIAAKAASAQTAGDYTNIINFAAISRVASPTINDITYMQDFAKLGEVDKAAVLASMAEEEAYTLYDIRDNEEYKVSKLKDGNIWMLDNLRFSDATYTMASSDTNIAEGTTYQFPHASGEWDDSYTDAYINADSKNVVVIHWGEGSGKVGTYYNYCATSAGTYCYDEGSGASGASYDICPTDWKMPSYSNYRNLLSLYDLSAGSDATNGFWHDFSVVQSGSHGSNIPSTSTLWSSSSNGAPYVYAAYIDRSRAYLGNAGRVAGRTLRCLLR